MKSLKNAAVLLASAVLAGACAYPAGPQDYHGYQVMGEQSVRFGVVQSVRPVRLHAGESGVGTVGGGTGQVAGAIGGAILGGIIGSNVERGANERQGLEVTVQLDSGQYVSIVQEADGEAFGPGDRVRVLSGRGSTRVTH